jgi:hypothetical protein
MLPDMLSRAKTRLQRAILTSIIRLAQDGLDSGDHAKALRAIHTFCVSQLALTPDATRNPGCKEHNPTTTSIGA